MSLLDSAEAFAREAHRDQQYGDKPYTYHLEAVVAEAERFGLPGNVIAAAWLHDVLEDTDTEWRVLKYYFNGIVADLVNAVTDRPGENRKERVAKTLPWTRKHGAWAIALKLCDRIANVKACIAGIGNHKLLKTYKKEYPLFRETLKDENEHRLDELWAELDKLLEWEAQVQLF
jgi:(p)ppGpp synthase/HD superfamily hydrolase